MSRRPVQAPAGGKGCLKLFGLAICFLVVADSLSSAANGNPTLLIVLALGTSAAIAWRFRVNDARRRDRELREAKEQQERELRYVRERERLARERELQAVRAREIATYHRMSPREFEEALAYLCQRDGCTMTQVVGGAGDLGADVIGVTAEGWKMVIQARWLFRRKDTAPAPWRIIENSIRRNIGRWLRGMNQETY